MEWEQLGIKTSISHKIHKSGWRHVTERHDTEIGRELVKVIRESGEVVLVRHRREEYPRAYIVDISDSVFVSVDGYAELQADNERLRAQRTQLVEALKALAIGPCCLTPGCNVDEPKCDVMVARAALQAAKGGNDT